MCAGDSLHCVQSVRTDPDGDSFALSPFTKAMENVRGLKRNTILEHADTARVSFCVSLCYAVISRALPMRATWAHFFVFPIGGTLVARSLCLLHPFRT